MKRMRWISTAMLGVALLGFTLLCAKRSIADEGHKHGGHNHKRHEHGSADAKQAIGPHGGVVQAVGRSFCEVCFTPKNVRVYFYDSKGKSISTEGVRGVVRMAVDDNPKQYRYDLYPESTKNSKLNSLYLSVDLSKIPDDAMSTSFTVLGLPESPNKTFRFSQRFKLSETPEQRAVAKQGICPVSGQKLGSMGGSIKVSINGRDVYVCCKGCVNRLKQNPQKYLARLPQTNTGPVKAGRADARAVAFQKTCPVMDEPLDSMGGPWKINVKGREVFVCCKGCIKSLKKNPNKYLAMLPTPAPARATKSDTRAISLQKVCPVMDESLGSMGIPWKVYANGQPVFVCCKGCIKKVQQKPALYLSKLAVNSKTGRRVRR